MSENIPNEQMMESIKAEINYIAGEAYAKGFVMGKQVKIAEASGMDYQKGLEDMHNAILQMVNMNCAERMGAFGTINSYDILARMSFSEFYEKLTEYEEKKKVSKITEGDVVEYTYSDGTSRFIVFVISDDFCGGLSLDADREVTDGWNYSRIDDVRPTGEHYDISDLCKKMKEATK